MNKEKFRFNFDKIRSACLYQCRCVSIHIRNIPHKFSGFAGLHSPLILKLFRSVEQGRLDFTFTGSQNSFWQVHWTLNLEFFVLITVWLETMSRTAGTAQRVQGSGYVWKIRGSNTGRGNRFFSALKRLGKCWSPTSFLFSGNADSLPGLEVT
jgi:hypothetical protein